MATPDTYDTRDISKAFETAPEGLSSEQSAAFADVQKAFAQPSRYGSTSAPAPVATASSQRVSRYTPFASAPKPFGAGDERAIRDNARRQAQASVDAINEMAASELAAARQVGAERLGATRALGASTGVIGSPTGNAQIDKTRALNLEQENAIRATKATLLAKVNDDVNTRGDTLVKAARDDAGKKADDYVAFLKDQSEQALGDMRTLAVAGVDISPDVRRKLAEQTGYDPDTFDQLYKSMQVANSSDIINKDKPEIVGNKAVFFKRTVDAEGNISIESIPVDLPEGASTKEIKSTVSRDDGIYVLYKDGSYEKIGQPSRAPVGGSGLTPYQRFQGGLSLSTKVDKLTEASKEVLNRANLAQQAYDRYASGESRDLNATTQVIINNFNKILDPASVVRESEYARSPAGQALMANIEGKLNKLAQGGAGLTKGSLKEFVDLGNSFAKNAKTSIDQEKARVATYGASFGLDTDFIGGGYVPPAPPGGGDEYDDAASAPIGATVTIDGIRYSKIGEDSYEPL